MALSSLPYDSNAAAPSTPPAIKTTPKAEASVEGKKGEHDCALGAGTELANDKVTTRKTPDGKTVLHAGAAFAGTAQVAANALLAKPESYVGKKVRVQGNVSAMCTHKRAWFALAADDQSGRFVRVMTAPNFLVPADSIGKQAEAEGVIELIEVDQNQAQHIAGEHKLGDPKSISGVQKQVILRATGASFTG